ncbi:hypothetical protein Q9189_007569 [Teloschistes chrysophthalmus]
MKEAIERGMQEAAKEAADLRAVEQGMAGLDTEKDGSFFQELRASEAEMEAEKKAAAEEKARAAEKKAEEMAKAMEEKRRKREEWEDGKVWKGVMKEPQRASMLQLQRWIAFHYPQYPTPLPSFIILPPSGLPPPLHHPVPPPRPHLPGPQRPPPLDLEPAPLHRCRRDKDGGVGRGGEGCVLGREEGGGEGAEGWELGL